MPESERERPLAYRSTRASYSSSGTGSATRHGRLCPARIARHAGTTSAWRRRASAWPQQGRSPRRPARGSARACPTPGTSHVLPRTRAAARRPRSHGARAVRWPSPATPSPTSVLAGGTSSFPRQASSCATGRCHRAWPLPVRRGVFRCSTKKDIRRGSTLHSTASSACPAYSWRVLRWRDATHRHRARHEGWEIAWHKGLRGAASSHSSSPAPPS